MQPYLITPPRPKGSVETRRRTSIHNESRDPVTQYAHYNGENGKFDGCAKLGEVQLVLGIQEQQARTFICTASIDGCVWPSKFSPSAEKGEIVCL